MTANYSDELQFQREQIGNIGRTVARNSTNYLWNKYRQEK